MEAATHSTDLFERYLQAVRKYLPAQRQDDIVAELRANLDAQREERETELGRPLTEGEMIDWLKELGPPMEMAARYQPPRYLIGPAIFPLYWHILRIVLVIATAVYAIATIALALAESHAPSWIASAVVHWPSFLIVPAAWVTAIFVALEFVSERFPDKCPDFLAVGSRWSPSTLPLLENHPPASRKSRTLTTAVAEFVVEWALLLWLLLIPHYPFLILGPGTVFLRNFPLRFTPVVVWFYWAVVVFSIVQLVWHGYNLLSNRWRAAGSVQKLVTKALGIVPIAILFAAPGHVYVELSPGGTGHLPPGLTLADSNHGLFLGVAVVTLITVAQFLWEIWKVTTQGGHQSHPVLL